MFGLSKLFGKRYITTIYDGCEIIETTGKKPVILRALAA